MFNFPEKICVDNEFAVTSLGRRDYNNVILKRDLGIDIHEFTIGGEPVAVNEASDNDVWMIQENKITITPIYNSLYSHSQRFARGSASRRLPSSPCRPTESSCLYGSPACRCSSDRSASADRYRPSVR